jgi:tRNA A37 N6-isopentenylltransferase MiaA
VSLADAAQATKWATHSYVRRQDLWLKRQPEYTWIEAGPDAVERAAALIEPFLRR